MRRRVYSSSRPNILSAKSPILIAFVSLSDNAASKALSRSVKETYEPSSICMRLALRSNDALSLWMSASRACLICLTASRNVTGVLKDSMTAPGAEKSAISCWCKAIYGAFSLQFVRRTVTPAWLRAPANASHIASSGRCSEGNMRS